MECGSGRSKAGRRDDDNTPPPLTPETEGSSPWATRKIVDFRFVPMGETRKCTLMAEPVDATTFWSVIGGVVAVGTGALGWVSKSNSAALEELWKARNETHEAVTQVRVLVAGQPTRGEFQAMEQRLLSAIEKRKL